MREFRIRLSFTACMVIVLMLEVVVFKYGKEDKILDIKLADRFEILEVGEVKQLKWDDRRIESTYLRSYNNYKEANYYLIPITIKNKGMNDISHVFLQFNSETGEYGADEVLDYFWDIGEYKLNSTSCIPAGTEGVIPFIVSFSEKPKTVTISNFDEDKKLGLLNTVSVTIP